MPHATMPKLLAPTAIVLLTLALPAQAYIGPGSGLGAFGVLAGMLAAIGLAIVGFFWYPLKRLLGKSDQEPTEAEPEAIVSATEEPGPETRG